MHTIRKNFALVCELLLILYRWANGEAMSREFLEEHADKRIRQVLNTMFQHVPRMTGDGYNTPKIHETTHFV